MTNETSSDCVQTVTDKPQTNNHLSASYKSISQEVLEIERRILRNEMIAPAELAMLRSKLCAYLGWANAQYATLKIALNRHHKAHRANHKSDKACEAEWLSSEEGGLFINLKYLRQTLDRLQSTMRMLWDDVRREV